MATTKTKIGNFEFENCFMNAAGVYCYDKKLEHLLLKLLHCNQDQEILNLDIMTRL